MFQEAIILDELPSDVLSKIEMNTSYENIYNALNGVDLSGYFQKVNDPERQRQYTATMLVNFFEVRKQRNNH